MSDEAPKPYDWAGEQDRLVREHIAALICAWDNREAPLGERFAAQAVVMHARAIVALMGSHG